MVQRCLSSQALAAAASWVVQHSRKGAWGRYVGADSKGYNVSGIWRCNRRAIQCYMYQWVDGSSDVTAAVVHR